MTDITWTTKKRKLAELVEWSRNPRQLSKHDADHIKRSIDKFGLADPLVVNADGQIIGGHQRKRIMLAMREFGPDAVIDVRVPSRELTPDEAAELNVRLNRNSGEWDWDVLANEFELDDLKDWGFTDFDFQLAGWDNGAEPPPDPGPQIDRAAELQQQWGTALGQVWELGDHRLVCGDCTDAAVVDAVMRGERADLMVTDPPYGINIVGDRGTAGNFPGTSAPRLMSTAIVGDDQPFNPSHLLLLASAVVLWGANHYADKLPASSKWLVWDKKDGAFKESDLGDCELAWTNQTGAARLLHHTWQGMYRKGEGERATRLHPTQKPVALMEWCIEQTDGADIVLDCYVGSGTTLIACERLGHRCRAIEIEPKYVAVTLQRWHDMTGRDSVLVAE